MRNRLHKDCKYKIGLRKLKYFLRDIPWFQTEKAGRAGTPIHDLELKVSK